MSGLHETPLTSKESIVGGCSLILFATIVIVTQLINLSVFDYDPANISTEDELEDFHDTLKNNKTTLLIATALLWFTLPLVLTHVYSMKRTFETIFSFEDNTCWKWFYIISWIVIWIVVCLLAVMMLISSYYDWEFTDDDGNTVYTGYYLQLMAIRLCIVLSDGILLAVAISSVIPWIVILFSIYGYCVCPYQLSDGKMAVITMNTRKQLLKALCCISLGRDLCAMLLLFFVILIFFGAFSDMFDWDSNGFWSLHGATQILGVFAIISYIFVGIWQIYMGLNANSIQKFTRHLGGYDNIDDASKPDLGNEAPTDGSKLL